MYSTILKFVCFSFILYKTVNAAVAIFPPEDKPEEFEDEEGCYLSSLDLLLDVGVPYSPQDGISCTQYLCRDNGETSCFTCGSIGTSKGCKLVPGNKTLPYPDCCDFLQCNNDDKTGCK